MSPATCVTCANPLGSDSWSVLTCSAACVDAFMDGALAATPSPRGVTTLDAFLPTPPPAAGARARAHA